ncbi:MAG: universal stress protein [Flavobacteriales bacterium]|nr:universal stress protein [Flavobacteriales bacterium]
MDYKFKKILIGFDNSAASLIALEKAIKTCEAFGAELYLIHVNNDTSKEDHFKDFMYEKAENTGIKIHYVERKGNVSRELQLAEKEVEADLIFLGSHGLNGFQPYWIGSNAIRVVGASHCPVITVQATSAEIDFKNIILPLDNSDETRQKVPYAKVFAKAFNSRVHIYCVSKDSSNATKNKLKIYGKQVADYLKSFNIDYTLSQNYGGSVAQMCIDYAFERKAGLIMMMTETESDSWFMGTLAQQLINHSTVPVMSIHSRDLYLSGASGY